MLPGVRALLMTLRLVAGVLAATVVLTACGGDDPSIVEPIPSPSKATQSDVVSEPRTEPPAPSPSPSADAPSASPPMPALAPSEPFGLAEVTLVSPDGGQRQTLPVYVAATSAERGRGLMDRDELPEEAGMVFLFPRDSSGAFYMYRTRIPLSIAFFDAAGTVVSVLDMEPCTSQDASACERYNPEATYRGALEVNQGAFDELGVDPGWTVQLPSGLPSPS